MARCLKILALIEQSEKVHSFHTIVHTLWFSITKNWTV